MRKHLLAILVLCGLLAFASPGWSLTIDGGATDVGGKDVVYASDSIGSGYHDELAWVQSELGTDYTFTEAHKYDVGGEDWIPVDDMSGYYAVELLDEPTYFLVKIGTGSLPAGTPDHYLFTNSGSLSYAVVRLSDINITDVTDITRISHIGEIGGISVPEPSTMVLFVIGSGLIGLLGLRKRIK